MTLIDLQPAAQRMSQLIEGIGDDQLVAPTPCTDTSVAKLLDHVSKFAVFFAAAARKDPDAGARGGAPDASELGDDWRTRIPRDLALLADAWRDPAAWSGMTKAGGADMPGEVAGMVTLDELVLHGWDVAAASGQSYECDEESLEAVHGFVAGFAEPGQEAQREGLFGPVVEVADDAVLLDRVLGLAGRDPGLVSVMSARDLAPAAQRIARLVDGLRDDQLDLPTPCPSYTVGELLAHVHGLSLAFAVAARKERSDLVEHAPGDDALPPLPDDWRTLIPAELATLAAAWVDEDAWTGTTRIAGGDTPGEVAGLVCLDELVVHGWDLARATGQDYECDQVALEGSLEVLGYFQVPGKEVPPGSAFGTVLEVPDGAPLLDRVVAFTGRDPAWAPE